MSQRRKPADDSRPGQDGKQALRVWLQILDSRKSVESQLRMRFRDRFASTLPRFDFAAALYVHPDGLPMGELANHMKVTKGNITAIADPLEAEGIIERRADATDRRSQIVSLTKKGRRSFAQRAKVHENWIDTLFSDLSAKELEDLQHLLAKLNRSIEQNADRL